MGLGSFGASVAVTLQRMGCDVVAIDQDMECVEAVADQVAYAMQADIGNPDLLPSLGLNNFDGVVVAVAEDMEASIMATLVAKEIGIPRVLCKARDDRHAAVLRKIGADTIVFPEVEMGKRIAKNHAVRKLCRLDLLIAGLQCGRDPDTLLLGGKDFEGAGREKIP